MPRGKAKSSLEARFLKRTVRTACPVSSLDDCWIWTGGKTCHPYAQVTKQTYGTTLAHQWSCHHWNKSPLPVEKGMCIRHKCDVRLCVNPAHLEYGTLQENIQDMVDRNPHAMGRIAPTDIELEMLKEMIDNDIPRREMSRQLAHSRHWIDRITKEYLN